MLEAAHNLKQGALVIELALAMASSGSFMFNKISVSH
jgi:hypothetical protein